MGWKKRALRLAAAILLLFCTGCESAAAVQAPKADRQPAEAAVSSPQSAAPKAAPAGGKTLPVENIQQRPEFPSGCEITSAAIALNYRGYEVSRETLAGYLPCSSSFSRSDGRLYGPDPRETFVGSPDTDRYGCYAPVVVEAVNRFLAGVGASENSRAVDLTGTPAERLYGFIDRGLPVIVWVTSGMEAPSPGDEWFLRSTGEYFRWIKKEHVMVLMGYTAGQAVFSDPDDARGTVFYDRALFARRYGELSRQAVVIE